MCVCVLRLKGKSIFVTTIQPIYIIMSNAESRIKAAQEEIDTNLEIIKADPKAEKIITSDLPVPEAIALTRQQAQQ